ncbi:hypothetical protein M422DRAFT_238412 [Sphaerobolus stellatus SS14]|nr:hypothetical protein M422DRAFT_238412 [Sphaerobolus stellatus SS14]
MDATLSASSSSLSFFIFVVIIFLTFFLAWLIISSCLGVSLRRGISELWQTSVEGARFSSSPGALGRPRMGAYDDWEMEMETRRRPM